MGGAAAGSVGRWLVLEHLVHQLVRLPHAHGGERHFFQRLGAAVLRQAQRGAGVALGEAVLDAELLLFLGEAEQTQLVGQRRLAQSQPPRRLGLGAAPQPDDLPDAPRRVKGVQLGALHVFQKAQRCGFALVKLRQDGGDLLQLGQTAGPQTALARHQLVAVQAKTAHAHRLEQSVLQNAHGQRGDLVVVKHGAGLIGGWLDPLQRQKNDPADLLFLSHLVLLSRGEQEGRIERAHTVRPCGSKDLVRGDPS